MACVRGWLCGCCLFLLCLVLVVGCSRHVDFIVFFFQGEDGIRDLVRSRWLGDVYKRQGLMFSRLLRALRTRKVIENTFMQNNDSKNFHDKKLSLIHI